ncbi:hypothetical protein [Reyranella sp.]|uniref:hypothetical protein n=1 Tax=Reyranella sp. TaxID=1929291 RepID=UPI003C7B2EB7
MTPAWATERLAATDMGRMLSTIERGAERRGLVLEQRGRIVPADDTGHSAPEGARFCTVARAAWAATDGLSEQFQLRHAHVAQLVAAVDRSARDRSGPVRVSCASWLLLRSYATTGMPPKRDA